MATAGDLVANLRLNHEGFRSDIAKSAKDLKGLTTQSTSGFRSGIASGIGFGIFNLATSAMRSMVGQIGESTAAFRESVAAQAKLNAVIAATGGAAGLSGSQIAAFASERQQVTNFDDDATIGAAAVLATFKHIKGDAFFEVLKSAQDLSTVMGDDLQSSVVKLAKAMNDPARGVGSLAKVGVSFTAAQKEQITTLTKQGKLVEAQRVILDEMNSQFGGAAEAVVDPSQQLANSIGDLKERIGGLLVPSLNALATKFVRFVDAFGLGADKPLALGEELGAVARNLQDVLALAALDFKEALTPKGIFGFANAGFATQRKQITDRIAAAEDAAAARRELLGRARKKLSEDLEKDKDKNKSDVPAALRGTVEEYKAIRAALRAQGDGGLMIPMQQTAEATKQAEYKLGKIISILNPIMSPIRSLNGFRAPIDTFEDPDVANFT